MCQWWKWCTWRKLGKLVQMVRIGAYWCARCKIVHHWCTIGAPFWKYQCTKLHIGANRSNWCELVQVLQIGANICWCWFVQQYVNWNLSWITMWGPSWTMWRPFRDHVRTIMNHVRTITNGPNMVLTIMQMVHHWPIEYLDGAVEYSKDGTVEYWYSTGPSNISTGPSNILTWPSNIGYSMGLSNISTGPSNISTGPSKV